MDKHLHFIWIGSPLPGKYRDNLERFREHNRSYQISLWVDHQAAPVEGVDVRPVDSLRFTDRRTYDSETNLGARADVLRYEIIHAHGGVYNDIDAISLRPLDKRFEKPFVSHTFEPWNNLTNAVFGFPAGHPFLKRVLRTVRTSKAPMVVDRTGPNLFTSCFLDHYGHGLWRDVCARQLPVSLVHQDLLIYPRKSSETNREVGFTYHLNDASWSKHPRRPSTAPRLSLCTAIKNRLDHLKQTLPQNIADAGPDTELVVLDYDSDDGLEEWIRPFSSNGLVSYWRVPHQRLWRTPHAKNLSSIVARGEVVCNVDADNYTNAGFSRYVVNHFDTKGGLLVAPRATEGVTGRIALRKSDFLAVGGYNEVFNFGWGCEDIDMVERARLHLGLPVTIIDMKYLRQIKHDDSLRGQLTEIADIMESNRKSLEIMDRDLKAGRYVANLGAVWGRADLLQEGCRTKSAN